MLSVGMVEVTSNNKVEVISVRNHGVTTAEAMNVARIVSPASVIWSAQGWVQFRFSKVVLLITSLCAMVEVTIVKKVNVIIMLDLRVTTARSVNVGVSLMKFVGNGNLAVLVAMSGVGVVKDPINKVVEMISMGD